MSTTATDLISSAYTLIGVTQPGETPEPSLMQQGLTRLNRMLGGWSLQNLTIPAVVRQVFALTANVGVYTIGPGGNFDTPRPTSLTGAAILLNNNQTAQTVTSLTSNGSLATATITAHGRSVGDTVTIARATQAPYNGTFPIATVPTANTFKYYFPGSATSPATSTNTITALFESDASDVTEIPCPILTDDMRQWIQIKTLTSTLATNVYWNPTFYGGLGTIELWPIPTVSTNALVLYRPLQLAQFPNLTQALWLPEGCEDAIEYQLAVRLCAANGVAVPGDVAELARTTLGTYKRSNTKMADAVLDAMWTMQRRGGYNILTGGYTGGGRS